MADYSTRRQLRMLPGEEPKVAVRQTAGALHDPSPRVRPIPLNGSHEQRTGFRKGRAAPTCRGSVVRTRPRIPVLCVRSGDRREDDHRDCRRHGRLRGRADRARGRPHRVVRLPVRAGRQLLQALRGGGPGRPAAIGVGTETSCCRRIPRPTAHHLAGDPQPGRTPVPGEGAHRSRPRPAPPAGTACVRRRRRSRRPRRAHPGSTRHAALRPLRLRRVHGRSRLRAPGRRGGLRAAHADADREGGGSRGAGTVRDRSPRPHVRRDRRLGRDHRRCGGRAGCCSPRGLPDVPPRPGTDGRLAGEPPAERPAPHHGHPLVRIQTS